MDAGGPSNLRLSSSRSSLRGGEIGVIGVRGVLKLGKIMTQAKIVLKTEVKQLCELPVDGVWLHDSENQEQAGDACTLLFRMNSTWSRSMFSIRKW